MQVCYLGIGSNLGNKKRNIESAIARIAKLRRTRLLKSSKIFRTKAVGGPFGQPSFLNAAVKIKTGLSPLRLLSSLKKIEKELGRRRTIRYGPRTIDLDILLYGNEIIKSRKLKIPHPRMFEREFVLKPLREIL
jgi:2-amino-4-hydroxy-6-hydroxymethyldihydropteridine diphosphokinase